MKKLMTLLVAVACVGIYSSESLAKNNRNDNRSDKERSQRQRERIKNGRESGELTNEEYRELRKQQRELNSERRDLQEQRQEAWSDGSMSIEERDAIKAARAELHDDRNEASQKIYNQKHDGDVNENRMDDDHN